MFINSLVKTVEIYCNILNLLIVLTVCMSKDADQEGCINTLWLIDASGSFQIWQVGESFGDGASKRQLSNHNWLKHVVKPVGQINSYCNLTSRIVKCQSGIHVCIFRRPEAKCLCSAALEPFKVQARFTYSNPIFVAHNRGPCSGKLWEDISSLLSKRESFCCEKGFGSTVALVLSLVLWRKQK